MQTIPRPEKYMENPFKGKDSRDYHTTEALAEANAEYDKRFYPDKSQMDNFPKNDVILPIRKN